MSEILDYKKVFTFSVHVKDRDRLVSLRNEVKKLYYNRYGVALTTSEAFYIGLVFARDILKRGEFTIGVRETTKSVKDIYGRIK